MLLRVNVNGDQSYFNREKGTCKRVADATNFNKAGQTKVLKEVKAKLKADNQKATLELTDKSGDEVLKTIVYDPSGAKTKTPRAAKAKKTKSGFTVLDRVIANTTAGMAKVDERIGSLNARIAKLNERRAKIQAKHDLHVQRKTDKIKAIADEEAAAANPAANATPVDGAQTSQPAAATNA